MQKKITIFTVVSLEDTTISRSFTTKRLAEDAQATLSTFGVESEVKKESKTIEI